MNTHVDSPAPRLTEHSSLYARRLCKGGIQVTSILPTSIFMTDTEARSLIDQLKVALAIPAPADDNADAEGHA